FHSRRAGPPAAAPLRVIVTILGPTPLYSVPLCPVPFRRQALEAKHDSRARCRAQGVPCGPICGRGGAVVARAMSPERRRLAARRAGLGIPDPPRNAGRNRIPPGKRALLSFASSRLRAKRNVRTAAPRTAPPVRAASARQARIR